MEKSTSRLFGRGPVSKARTETRDLGGDGPAVHRTSSWIESRCLGGCLWRALRKRLVMVPGVVVILRYPDSTDSFYT